MEGFTMNAYEKYLFPKAIHNDEEIKRHSHIDKVNSSQALCISAFGALRHKDYASFKDDIVNGMVAQVFSGMEANQWTIEIEVEKPELLNEYGYRTQPTSIDVVLCSNKSIVTVEAKFDTDAKAGFRSCSQYKGGNCAGYYGPNSDIKTRTSAWCRLESFDGQRTPRLYWAIGKAFFQPSVFKAQQVSAKCPFRNGHYQLMRNFLFAGAYAARNGLQRFGVIVVCPKVNSTVLDGEIKSFREQVLAPECYDYMQMIHYEDYIALLRAKKNAEACELADYLDQRIATVTNK